MGAVFLSLLESPALIAEAQRADPTIILIDEVGPSWSSASCPASPPPPEGGRVCFERRDGLEQTDFLIVTAQSIAAGIDPRVLVEGSSFGGQVFPTPGLELALGEAFQFGEGASVTIVMAAGGYLFVLILESSHPPLDAQQLLLDVALRQQARARLHANPAPSETAPNPPPETLDALDRLLLVPSEESGFSIIATGDLGADLSGLRAEGGNPAVIELLEKAPSRVRVLGFEGLPIAAVFLEEQPYDVFAAAGLGTFADRAPDSTLTRELARLPGAIGFRSAGESNGLAVVLRKGRYLAYLVAQPEGIDEQDLAVRLAGLAILQSDTLPPGGSAPYFFPSTLKSVVVSAAVGTALSGGALGLGPLLARRRRRRIAADGAVGAVRRIPQAQPPSVLDVTRAGTRLRRRGLVLVIVDVVAVNTIVFGLLGVTGALELPALVTAAILVTGTLGGMAFTAWWARRELRATGSADVPGELRATASGLVGGAVAVALLVLGMALLATALAGLAFGPSLAGLQRSDRIGVSPTQLDLGSLAVGVALLVAGGFAVRLARIWARAGAQRLKARDRRRPILYLRSFEDDALRLPVVVSARRPFLEMFAARGSDLFEESIAWQLTPYGPVVGIGRPGRPTHSLGAARELLPDDLWQQGVNERMADARSIVLILGATHGLRWEVSEIVVGGHLAKTVLVFPPVDDDVLRERWRFVSDALAAAGAHLPPLPTDLERILAAMLDQSGVWYVAAANVRDEATYRAAIDGTMGVATEATAVGQQGTVASQTT